MKNTFLCLFAASLIVFICVSYCFYFKCLGDIGLLTLGKKMPKFTINEDRRKYLMK